MKKKLLVVAGLIIALSLVGCGNKAAEVVEDVSTEVEQEIDEIDEIDEIEGAVEEAEEALDEEAKEEGGSLAEFIKGDVMKKTVDFVNEQLKESNLKCEFSSEGDDTLVIKYTFLSQQVFDGVSSEAIVEAFDKGVAPVLEEQGKGMVTELEGYGLSVKNLKLIINNADGTELYCKTFDM